MTSIKLMGAVLSFLIVAIGLVFAFLPHDFHEATTFGIQIPHFLHFAIGFAIICTGLIINKNLILNRKKIATIAVFLIFIFVLIKLLFPAEVKAETEFDRMKVVAREHCTDQASTDPKCLQIFLEIKEQGMKKSGMKKLQQTAQEKTGVVGGYTIEDFNPTQYLTTWNFNNLPPQERSNYYRETTLPNGTALREYWFYAEDREIEIAPGVMFPAWTYNGQVPAPTIRATEGDLIRIHFTNKGTKPHTMHFHGFHPSSMDGSMKEDFVYPGQNLTYEFKADPFGVHLFHCHSVPLKQHISKGLYGAYIVDPKNDTRPKADKELVIVMNGFDTNLDGENEVYAVNTKAFYYAMNPIKVKKGELVRIYLINILEFDPINSFHLHATFFDEYRTGTKQQPGAYTDITSFVQGERSILDVRFRYPGMYMFHAHQSEFTELGWMGFFEVEEY